MPASILMFLGIAGLAMGLGLLGRGLRAQRSAARIGDVGTSPAGLLAAGEVRVTGRAVSAGVTLTSPLRVRSSLYYRARVQERRGNRESTVLDDSRALGFFVEDSSGRVRVFPGRARWEVPFDAETTDADGDAGLGGLDALALGAEAPASDPLHPGRSAAPDFAMGMLMTGVQGGLMASDRRYAEARIEPGDVVTVVGRALPFRDLADPTEADRFGAGLATLTGAVDGNHLPDPGALDDPEVAFSYRQALARGELANSPAEAWGNAAIEGFGIGQPVRPPELDPELRGNAGAAANEPGASEAPLGRGAAAPTVVPASPGAPDLAAVQRDFEIPPDALVIAAGPGAALLVAAGAPGAAYARDEQAWLLGLLGAILAIGAALLLALALSGALGPLAGGGAR